MPVWHEKTKPAREAGELVLLGVIQEQHAERCRLYAQWQELDWTIVQDPINRLRARAVPMFVAVDESGVVVDGNLRADEYEDFLARPKTAEVDRAAASESVDAGDRESKRVDKIAAAEDRLLWGNPTDFNRAVSELQAGVLNTPDSAPIWFSLGVALRMRHESEHAQASDFQDAVNAWDRALQLDPNQYIYRRRIEQYGPRLIKPYPFYDWVDSARKAIRDRGEKPVKLSVEPSGAEIAAPIRPSTSGEAADVSEFQNPDPSGRITRAGIDAVSANTVVVPGRIKPGNAVRVHVKLEPTALWHWNNEAEPMRLWVDAPEGWKIERPLRTFDQPREPESREVRSLEFELTTSADAVDTQVKAFCLFYACEELGGQCVYRRVDIDIPIRFQSTAARSRKSSND